MKTVNVPTDEDLTRAAKEKYERQRNTSTADDLAWDELHPLIQEREIAAMRAAYETSPHVAKAFGLRTYSLTVAVPEVGQTVIYQGWPAVVTMTQESAQRYQQPAKAQAALPPLRSDLHVHLHVLSALGPYPAHSIDHGTDGWLWPHEAVAEVENTAMVDAESRRRSEAVLRSQLGSAGEAL
jgi:hypothetical protein